MVLTHKWLQMTNINIKLIVPLLLAVGCCLSLTHRSTATSANSTFVAGQNIDQKRGLTAEEKRGRAFYLRGETSSGEEIIAMVGEIDVPASTVTCAGCHGARGEGKTEGGVTAGNLAWSFLTKPYGHVDDGKRKHPAFTENSFIRTMTAGVDPAGNKLSVAMPTYRLSQRDMADLIAYLKRIETDRDPGVTETAIVVGTVVPEKGALAETGQAMREMLQAYFDEVNRNGGIYSRKIELRVAVVAGDTTSTVANAKYLIEDESVFAMVSGLTAGADEKIATLSQDAEVPFIGPSTLLPQTSFPLNRYVFYLLPGLKEQAGALVNFAVKKIDRQDPRVAIVSPDADLNRRISVSMEDRIKKLGLTTMSGKYYPREHFNAAGDVAVLKQQGVDNVFFLGSDADLKALITEGEAAGYNPTIYALGVLVGKDISAVVPVKMKDKIFLAFPTIPADLSAVGAATFGALLEKNKLGSRHAAARLSALAAATILVEGLKLAGKDLSRERLVNSLEGLYEFDTGFTPRITFGPNRRIGALGAYVVTIDPEKKLFPATVQWIASE